MHIGKDGIHHMASKLLQIALKWLIHNLFVCLFVTISVSLLVMHYDSATASLRAEQMKVQSFLSSTLYPLHAHLDFATVTVISLGR